jgi:type IV secretory pathway VirB2 component (pilin)
MKKVQLNKAVALIAALAPAIALTTEVVAYTVGTATSGAAASFDAVLAEVVGWLEGPLGTLLAVICFGLGLAMGAAQQSLMAVAVGIFFAAAFQYGPTVLQGVSGAAGSAL